jgi:hypothetical protein
MSSCRICVTLERLEGIGHFTPLEAAEAFAAAIKSRLPRPEAPRASRKEKTIRRWVRRAVAVGRGVAHARRAKVGPDT